MKQKFTILFDLDGTLIDTAPDLIIAHNHVMKKFGYPTKSTNEIRNLVGQGAGAMLGRSIWGQAKKEFGKVQDEKIKKEMVKDFVDYYGKNIVNESTLIDGVKDFLIWSKKRPRKKKWSFPWIKIWPPPARLRPIFYPGAICFSGAWFFDQIRLKNY